MTQALDSDAQLLKEASAGNRLAFGALVRRHRASVYRFARALVQDDATAEDLLQDTFVIAAQHLADVRAASSLRQWLFTITRTRAGKLARARRETDDEPLETLAAEAGYGSETPEALTSRVEQAAQLERALAKLAPEEREILVLRDLEELSGEETAEALGVSLAAMKSRLHRARLRLVAVLKQEVL